MYIKHLFDPDEVPAELLDCFDEVETVCGAPLARAVETSSIGRRDNNTGDSLVDYGMYSGRAGEKHVTTLGFRPTCDHDAPAVPCTVFDPFIGSGTTALVARKLGRRAVGIDLSFDYLVNQARSRLSLDALEAWENGPEEVDENFVGLPMFENYQENNDV